MNLFHLFKKKKKEPLFKGRVLDYHEDDFCRIELRPRENLQEINQDLKAADEINRHHKTAHGFTKVHVIEEKKVTTLDRRIPPAEIDRIIASTGLKKFDNVTTGSGSRQYDSEYSTAYGERGCAVIYERREQLSDRIWLEYFPAWAKEPYRSPMESCLQEICSRWNLILVDWRQELVVDPADAVSLRDYLYGVPE